MNKTRITYDLLYFRLDTLNFLTRWVDDSADYSAYAINEKGELTANDGKVIIATGLKKTALWQCMTAMCKGVVYQGKLKGYFKDLNYTELDKPLLLIG